jgi:hypothetical protein
MLSFPFQMKWPWPVIEEEYDFNGDDAHVWKTAKEIATPTIDSKIAASDGNDNSAGCHVIDQTKPHMKKPY